ncbi:unnamed protein product [Rhizopus stolonifer]
MDFKAILPVELFKTLNDSLTAQAIVRISPLFFEKYQLLRNESSETALYCLVYAKGLNTIFKKNNANVDHIKNCEIHITEGDLDNGSRLHIKVLCHNGVLKKDTIWYGAEEKIIALYPKDQSHSITINPMLLKDYLDIFSTKVIDISFECTPEFIIIKTFWDYNSIHTVEKPVQSSFKIKVSECMEYAVTEPVKLIFNLREFKVILDYMAMMEAPLEAHFDEPGRPILLNYRQNNEVIAEFALNTQTDTFDGQVSFNEHSIGSIDTYAYSRQSEEPTNTHIHSRHRREPTNASVYSRHREEPASSSLDPYADTEPMNSPPRNSNRSRQRSLSIPLSNSNSPEPKRTKRNFFDRE